MQGLAFEGGGAKGAYQIGAYQALIENGYKFDAIVGTSIGSINAVMLCQGSYKTLIKMWKELDATIFGMDPDDIKKIVNKEANHKKLKRNAIFKIVKNKGIDLSALRALLEKYIDEDKVRNSKIKFGLVTVRLRGYVPLELTIDEIPQGKLIDYLIASCSLPVFKLKPIIDDHIYLDGGYYNVLPLTLLERLGCDEIVGIRLKKFGLIKRVRNKNIKVKIIKPGKNTGSIIFLDPKVVKENIERGYNETLIQLGIEKSS